MKIVPAHKMSGVGVSAPELLLLFIRLLTLTGGTLGHENGPAVVKVVVKEGSAAILPCSLSTKENIESKLFDWKKDDHKEVFFYDAGIHYNNGRPGQDEQFKGRVSHYPDELKHGNASIKITNTKGADSGVYTCIFPRLQPERKFHIQLVVELTFKDRSGEITGAAPQLYITTLGQTEDGVLLQCEVRGASPKPQLQWQDSAGNILPAEKPQVSERGGSYDITLLTMVTKTDRFTCVATQEDIKHQIYSETFVYIHEEVSEDSSSKVVTGWSGGLVLGALAVVAVQALLVAAKCITIGRYKGSPEQRNVSWNKDSAPLNSPV